MKFFTQGWLKSTIDDTEMEREMDAYFDYIGEVEDQFPFALKLLANDIHLHDGIIHSVDFDQDAGLIELIGIFGDLQVGYFLLKFQYRGVEANPDKLSKVMKDKELEVLMDECELLGDGKYAHRLCFTNIDEIEIRFKDIDLEIKTATPDDYFKAPCRLKI